MTEEAEGRRLEDGAAPNIYINATKGGVAAYHIENLIIDGLAELQSATTVLPLEVLVVEPTPFVGRESELTRIADLISGSGDSPSNGIVVVSGPPGVGKTALVRQAATAAAAAGRFEHVLFVDLRGYADDPAVRVQPAVVFSKLLILLGVGDDEIAADPAEQAIQYQQRLHDLAAEGKSVLLWLDNASDPSQFEPLWPGTPFHRVAVTTRETFGRIPKPQVVDVDVMEREYAAVFDKCWLYLGHESELPRPGDFVTRSVARRNILFTRDAQGVPNGDASDPEVSYDGKRVVFAMRCPVANTSTIDGAPACTGRWNLWEYDMRSATQSGGLLGGSFRFQGLRLSPMEAPAAPVQLPPPGHVKYGIVGSHAAPNA